MNRSVIVSGGSRGLGQAICEMLLADGWQVATFSRRPSAFTQQSTEAYPERFHYAAVDISDNASLYQFVNATIDPLWSA